MHNGVFHCKILINKCSFSLQAKGGYAGNAKDPRLGEEGKYLKRTSKAFCPCFQMGALRKGHDP